MGSRLNRRVVGGYIGTGLALGGAVLASVVLLGGSVPPIGVLEAPEELPFPLPPGTRIDAALSADFARYRTLNPHGWYRCVLEVAVLAAPAEKNAEGYRDDTVYANKLLASATAAEGPEAGWTIMPEKCSGPNHVERGG